MSDKEKSWEDRTVYERQQLINRVGDKLVRVVLNELDIPTAKLGNDGAIITRIPIDKATTVIGLLSHFNWRFKVCLRHREITTGTIDLTIG